MPVSRLDTVLAQTQAMPVYLADGVVSRPHNHVDWIDTSALERPYTPSELLVEILVLGQMIRKRIARGAAIHRPRGTVRPAHRGEEPHQDVPRT